MKDLREIKDYQIVVLGLLIALGTVLSTYILSLSIIKFQEMNTQALSVTGSASQNVKSDFAVWKGYYESRNANLKTAYAKLEADSNAIKVYLKEKGIEDANIKFSPVNSYPIYKRTSSGYETNDVEGYRLSQRVEVSSNDIDKITNLSKNSASLINKNVELTSNSVEYLVSNLNELKIKVLAEATKDAKKRAESMVKSTNGKIGVMKSAKMGVFQIVPVNSTEVSDYGINDTQAIDKKVNAVVNATFTIK